jgi:hypothetical protein
MTHTDGHEGTDAFCDYAIAPKKQATTVDRIRAVLFTAPPTSERTVRWLRYLHKLSPSPAAQTIKP